MGRPLMRTPRAVDLEITSRCNAACRYCYYLHNPNVVYTDLPTGDWLAFFAELRRCQVLEVNFLGGEPLLREDFFDLVDGVVANRMRFSLMTNGSLLTADIAARLKATGRCNMVQVSLDGSCADVHESLRGRDTFQPALNAITTLQAAALPVTVRVTVHPGNVDDLPALTALLLDDLQLPAFSTNAASSLGSAGKYGANVLLQPQQRLRAMQLLASLDLAYPGRILANAGPLADWRSLQALRKARQSGVPIPGRGRLVGCGCVFNQLAVRADGAMIPCVMLPQMVLGQIGCDPLDEVWQSAPGLERMRGRVDISLQSFAECRDCEWLHSCTGNCPGTAFTRTGDMNRPCPDACPKRLLEELAERGLTL